MYRGRGGGGGNNMARSNRNNRNKPRHLDARDIIRSNISVEGGSSNDGYGRFDDYGDNPRGRSKYSQFRGGRGKPFRGGRARAHTAPQLQHSGPDESPFKITVFNGARFPQNEIITIIKQALGTESDVPFFNIGREKNNMIFWVLGNDNSATLKSLSRRIKSPTGQSLAVFSQRHPLPPTNVDANMVNCIKTAMSLLYDTNSRVMNLSNFRDAPVFRDNGMFVSLARPNLLKQVVDIIMQNAPDIVALNLSNNKIHSLESLTLLAKHCQSLKALDLSRNKISRKDEIERLKGMDLLELILEGNPISEDSRIQLISLIRKVFKNLKKLDSEDLPPEIGFDVGTTVDLPPEQESFFPNPEVKGLVEAFLKIYFDLYDSDNRKDLLQAYHDSAVFTYSVAHLGAPSQKSKSNYLSNSHNLWCISDESDYISMMKTSSVEIVAQLSRMPNTKHLLETFKIDVPYFDQNMLYVVVTGLFIEVYKTNAPTRGFMRTFLLVPQNGGWVIVNDMLYFTTSSNAQSVKFKDLINQTAAAATASLSSTSANQFSSSSSLNTNFMERGAPASMQAPSGSSSSLLSVPVQPAIDEQLLQQFMQATKMNRDFSLKCLLENNFDANAAYNIFMRLKESNALPPEAFI